ncbi:tRNA1(Val) (adenine(37)-N6)-methyltransferase [Sediminitomix flava]|uniref:tRNA1(Val) (adenine(37)-N6)-methyltransferase n=1 Tax=Sediminitomix flava TaxID=379075 RepID=A0A315ZCW0_SEDFL|nr:methyltransferase [Sediminitomix flava]PWJ43391.1 tRNA1Val (adenine37-N6)-methyltransferase [Sediminitomix flava]
MKKFEIHQDKCALKVGTDGIILGAWTNVNHQKEILDIGTGTGLISLMLAQRNKEALLTAIEIDKDASQQAQSNFSISPWKNRLTLEHSSLQEYNCTKKFDLIVSNPPFFNNALKSESEQKNTARHTDSLSQEDLLNYSLKHLKTEGTLSLILPCQEAEQITELASKKGLFLQRRCIVQNTSEAKPIRWMMEFSCTQPDSITEEKLIIREKDKRTYTEEFKMLTKDFYTIF